MCSSLPSWECGLKSLTINGSIIIHLVTPFVGVWIEIVISQVYSGRFVSLPSWECGLKSVFRGLCCIFSGVTPFVGVWIEITANVEIMDTAFVTPFVGVWIEIFRKMHV